MFAPGIKIMHMLKHETIYLKFNSIAGSDMFKLIVESSNVGLQQTKVIINHLLKQIDDVLHH